MVTINFLCTYCGSEKLSRNGHAPHGKQRYFCQECKRYSRENPSSCGYSEERKEEILRAYQERSSLRGLERTFGVSRYTVAKWVKKSGGTASLE
jgi:transposase-like protein